MLYMGWGITDEDIAWMNQVLKKHPDRMAILAFHEYLLVSGNRSPIGEKIFKEIVKPNPNVVMVLSGHYHSAMRKQMSWMMMVMGNRIVLCIKCWPIIRAGQKAAKGICVCFNLTKPMTWCTYRRTLRM